MTILANLKRYVVPLTMNINFNSKRSSLADRDIASKDCQRGTPKLLKGFSAPLRGLLSGFHPGVTMLLL
jgi:hypothetical protein